MTTTVRVFVVADEAPAGESRGHYVRAPVFQQSVTLTAKMWPEVSTQQQHQQQHGDGGTRMETAAARGKGCEVEIARPFCSY